MLAHIFGFVGGLKRKVCEQHSQILIDKQVTLYSIAAFQFVQSPNDAPLFERRNEQMQRGRGALTSLGAAREKTRKRSRSV